MIQEQRSQDGSEKLSPLPEEEPTDVVGELSNDILKLVTDLHQAERRAEQEEEPTPEEKSWLADMISRINNALDGLATKWGLKKEEAAPAPERVEAARQLMVKFDTAQPSLPELISGLRTVLEGLGNPVQLPKDFSDPENVFSKYHTNQLMNEIRAILEIKAKQDPAMKPLYEQARRLSHAIQLENRLRLRYRPTVMDNPLLITEDFSAARLQADQQAVAQRKAEFDKRALHREKARSAVVKALKIALEEIGLQLNKRQQELFTAVREGVATSDQAFTLDANLSGQLQQPALRERVALASSSANEHDQAWGKYAQELINLLDAITARGAQIELVILPTAPSDEQLDEAAVAK